MTLYAALLYYPQDRYWTDLDHAQHAPDFREFAEQASAADVLRPGGMPLRPSGTATTITVDGGKGGDVLVTDGPYAEAKEVLGGFFLIEADDLDEAIRWAAQIPTAWLGKVELRPIAPMQGGTAIRE